MGSIIGSDEKKWGSVADEVLYTIDTTCEYVNKKNKEMRVWPLDVSYMDHPVTGEPLEFIDCKNVMGTHIRVLVDVFHNDFVKVG